mgnify:FL=1
MRKEIIHIFRAYDIRGITGKTLFPDVIAKSSAIFANILKERGAKLVAVSGDGRTSSHIYTNAAAAGIAAAGLDVYVYDQLPISTFYFKVWKEEKIEGGAYVTASHNPPEWNGIRYRRGDGTGFSEENKIIRERFINDDVKWASWEEVGNIYHFSNREVIAEYLKFVWDLEPKPERKLKIIIDTMNGIGGILIPYLLSKHHDVLAINAQVDGRFPSGWPDPVDSDISTLQDLVVHTKANMGAAFDGDADRSVIVDDKGRRVQAEIVGILLAEELLKAGDVVVYNAECSSILREKLEEIGIKTVETRVGDVFVAETAKKHKAKLCIEGSYHIFLPIYGFYYDDAMLATYIFAAILTRKKKPLSEIVDEIGRFYVLRENIHVNDAIKWDLMDYMKERFIREYSDVSTIDGVKIYLERASVLIRPSNTEPMIRIISEARSEAKVAEIHKEFVKKVKKYIEEYSLKVKKS